MKITARLLRSHFACQNQVHIFAKQWPNGGAVTLENCRLAVKLGLDLDWAAARFLSPATVEFYVAEKTLAWEAREKAIDAAREIWEPAMVRHETSRSIAKARAAAFYNAWKMEHSSGSRSRKHWSNNPA